MLLDIFIPHWTEPWEVGKKGFDMLALQRLIDWNDIRITIVHDGTDPFPEEYFAGYPYNVNQERLPENRGIGAVRNYILDHARAQWLRMCDFDDMFNDPYALRNAINALQAGQNYDLLWHPIVCEGFQGERKIHDSRSPIVLHDKFFRTSWLKRKKIRFNEELTWCEDSAFLALMEMEIDHKRIGKILSDTPIYIWIARNGSLCNRPEIRWANRLSFFKRHRYVQDEFKRHGHMPEYYAMTLRVMGDSYYTLKVFETGEDRSEHEKEVEAYYMDGHQTDLLHLTRKHFDEVLDAVNDECWGNITKAELLEWLKNIRLRHEERGENVVPI